MAGNRKPQTFRPCAHCGRVFGPLDRLSQRFCGPSCKYAAARVVSRKRPTATGEARRAQRRARWLVQTGIIIKPNACEKCGHEGRVEMAHEDYARPEDVRWLCASCHRREDWANPKGGTLESLTDQQAERVHV